MALVEPGPTGVKTEAEAVAAIEHGNPDQKRRLGVTFWLSAGWIFTLVFLALFRDILPIRDPDELGIRTREVAKFESPGWNAFFGGDGQGRDMFARVVQGARPALILGARERTRRRRSERRA